MATFNYQPLDVAKNEIRLLTVLPGHFDDEIRVSLKHVPFSNRSKPLSAQPSSQPQPGDSGNTLVLMMRGRLRNVDKWNIGRKKKLSKHFTAENATQDERPYYEALSYAWGSQKDPKRVYVETESSPTSTQPSNGVILVTDNLAVALRHLRLETGPRVMWIDSICINQNDDVEKSHQVALMGSIYRGASQVMIWIGPLEDHSDVAMDLLGEIAENVEVDQSLGTMHPSETGRTNPHWAELAEPLRYDKAQTRSLYLLLTRPWFKRLWIRQEASLARTAVLQCGRKRMPWTDFIKAIYCLRRLAVNRSTVGDLLGPWLQTRYTTYELCSALYAMESLSLLRFSLRDVQWFEPRDAIYANLHMLDNDDRTLDIIPDYTGTTARIFEDIALSIIKSRSSLAFLETCELASRSTANLPSWVPDWSAKIHARCQFFPKWSACAWISAQTRVVRGEGDDGGLVLHAAGVHVSSATDVWDLEMSQLMGSPDKTIDTIRSIVKHVHLPGAYKHGGTKLTAYCRALLASIEFAEDREDQNPDSPSFEKCQEVLSATCSAEGLCNIDKTDSINFFTGSTLSCDGRCFFSTTDGYIGLGPAGMRRGDAVCVVLGCQVPVILRPAEDMAQAWQVFGACFVPGLMAGEAIHGTFPNHYQPIKSNDESSPANGMYLGLLDQRDGSLKADPADILAEMGIPHMRQQARPHILEVSPEALRRVGVDLQDFRIV